MAYRCTKCLFLCVGVTFLTCWFIASMPIQSDSDMLPRKSRHVKPTANKERLAILVPFRDRFEELLQFVPHMTKFLEKQKIPFHVFVVQQADSYRFNRASLINVGFLYVNNNFDYIAMHDVDLLPLNDNLKYDYPDKGPFHVSAPDLHPKYHYSTFIGGILLIKNEHFELVNGMSNRYWGWGLEDDEFYVRLKDASLSVFRPTNVATGIENTFKHVHDKTYRKRDMRRCYNQREVTRKRDRQTGLRDVLYTLHKVHNVTIDGLPLTVLNVELHCNKNLTPWCSCPELTVKNNSNNKVA